MIIDLLIMVIIIIVYILGQNIKFIQFMTWWSNAISNVSNSVA